jgi:hypothetical protein
MILFAMKYRPATLASTAVAAHPRAEGNPKQTPTRAGAAAEGLRTAIERQIPATGWIAEKVGQVCAGRLATKKLEIADA